MELCFIKKHMRSKRHERHIEKMSDRTMPLTPIFKAEQVRKSLQECNLSTRRHEEYKSVGPRFMDAEDFSMEMDDTMDLEIPLSEFLNDITASGMVEFSEGVTDLFAELQEMLASGQIPFSTPLAPINKEYELDDYSVPDFGIEIPGMQITSFASFLYLNTFTFTDNDPPATRAAFNTVTPDSPTYPWPSKAVSTCYLSCMIK